MSGMTNRHLVLTSNGIENDIPVERLPITIGRNQENDIVLPYGFVSGRHGRIVVDNGGFVYQDLKSTNGTYVDGELVSGQMRVLAGSGCMVFGSADGAEVAYRITGDEYRHEDGESRLFQEGYAHLRQGNYRHAFECFEKILADTPKSPAIYCYAGLAASRIDDLDTAILRFEQYLALMPRDVQAMVDLGKLYERKGQLGRASARYHRALELKPGDREISDRLRNLNRYEPVSDAFHGIKSTEEILGSDLTDTVSTMHFEVTYNIARHGRRLNDVLKTLEEAYLSVGEHLDLYPKGKVPVVLCTREGALEKSAVQAVGTGTKRGIKALITPRTTAEAPFIKVLLIHEYVHYLIESITPEGVNLPWWFHEGLAQYESQNMRVNDDSLMARMALNEAFIPLEMLEKWAGDDGVDGLTQLAYSQAYSLIDHCVTTHGWETIRVLIKSFVRGRGRAAFEDAGIDYIRLEDHWRKWLDLRLNQGPAGRTVQLS